MTKHEDKPLTAIRERYESSMSETAFTDAICAAYDLGRLNAALPSGEPPQPRCPKCGSTKLAWIRGYTSASCSECHAEIQTMFLSDFAQFFGPSAPQPQPAKSWGFSGYLEVLPDHKSMAPSGSAGQEPQCRYCGQKLQKMGDEWVSNGVFTCWKNDMDKRHLPLVVEPEGRAESAIERAAKRDLQVITEPIDWEAVENGAQPVAANPSKVEEVARQINDAYGPCLSEYIRKEREHGIAAILRPYLQVSQPPKDMDEVILRAVDKCNPATDGERFCLYNIIEIAIKEALSVTPVSGNGTEPPDHVIDVAVARIAQELDWHLPDTDLIEFGATVYKEALRMVRAASRNGQEAAAAYKWNDERKAKEAKPDGQGATEEK